MILERLNNVCHCRGLLTDSHIDAIYGVTCLVALTLVNDGINSYGGLTRLTVTDN